MYYFKGTSTCRHGELRLTSGKSDSEGRVEMCYNGIWGSVCANGWDQVDANLVCAQLGYFGQRARSKLYNMCNLIIVILVYLPLKVDTIKN